MLRIVLVLCAVAIGLPVEAARGWSTPASAVLVIDGDTLDLAGERVRLWGIDAPEVGQRCSIAGKAYDCGAAAEASLFEALDGRALWCAARDVDRYGRTVAVCRLGGEQGPDLGDLLVRAGWAVDFRRYSKGAYARAEQVARDARAGLWAGEFIDPATCRKERCQVRKGEAR